MRRDPERTLAAVRAIGYTDVELLWSLGNFGRTTARAGAGPYARSLGVTGRGGGRPRVVVGSGTGGAGAASGSRERYSARPWSWRPKGVRTARGRGWGPCRGALGFRRLLAGL